MGELYAISVSVMVIGLPSEALDTIFFLSRVVSICVHTTMSLFSQKQTCTSLLLHNTYKPGSMQKNAFYFSSPSSLSFLIFYTKFDSAVPKIKMLIDKIFTLGQSTLYQGGNHVSY